MRKYITSDKVGELVAALRNAGFAYISVEPEEVSIRHADMSYTFVRIFEKESFDSMLKGIIEAEKSIREAVEFDNTHETNAA